LVQIIYFLNCESKVPGKKVSKFLVVQDDMNYAENYVRFLCKWLLEHCRNDMEFMVKNFDKTAIDRLELVSSTPFKRISYTEAVHLLQNVKDKQFENKVEWGIDLASEHERYWNIYC